MSTGRGTWWRWDARRTVDNVLALDVREVCRGGGLRPGRQSVVSWSRGWGGSAVSVEGDDEDGCWIAYSLDGQPVRQRIELKRTPCNYGGERAWWSCPKCGRRCAILYLLGDRLECRPCAGLTYTTSQSSRWIRSVRKSVARGRRIGVQRGVPYVVKPRGMHQRTFERLVAEYRSASGAATVAMRPVLERLQSERGASLEAARHALADEKAALDSSPDVPSADRARWRAAIEHAADLLDPPAQPR